ncbi:MAG: putative toxin-antitoxin system toxin component, PIN family [Thermoplasmata archaeon]|nr:putative toxin-antitoxin system toxin component, PIN family [Thermoplasmata archaeon]
MKIVLDTNVFVSALFWNGNERQVLNKCRTKELELIISPEILNEIDRVLELKFSVTDDKRGDYLRNIILVAKLVFPASRIGAIKSDISDNRILECAVDANAEFIVSGDGHLLSLAVYEGITILNASAFLKVLKSS